MAALTYTRKQVLLHRDTSSCWTIIHNKVYDITSWVPDHPGGDLIRQGAGLDCTAIFESSHPPYVNEEYLEKYKIGELDSNDKDTRFEYKTEFWTVLKSRVWSHFKKNKITRHDCFEYYAKAFSMLSSFFLFYILGIYYERYVFTLIAACIGPMAAICVMHDGQHGAASKYPIINQIMGWSIDFFGSSGIIWKHEHNLGHHQYTNTDTDPDAVSGAPFVRLSPLSPRVWFHRYQHIYVWFMYSTIMLRWYFVDFGHFITRDFGGNTIYPPSSSEVAQFWAGKMCYFIYTFLIPSYMFGVGWGVLYFLTFTTAASYMFAFQFTVNHLTPDTIWHEKDKETEKDWAKAQIMTASNYAASSRVASFFSGGLNNQIEHHLFPTFSHVQYKYIVPIVRETCKEYKVPYINFSTYREAILSHFHQLKHLGNP